MKNRKEPHARPQTVYRMASGLALLALAGLVVGFAAAPASALFTAGCSPRIGSEAGARCGASALGTAYTGGGVSCGPRSGPDQFMVGCDYWGY